MARTAINGTNGKDTIDVRHGNNDVRALGGNDIVRLLSAGDTGGNNFVDAGSGNDTVINHFEGGNEILLGSGNDIYVNFGFNFGVGDIVRAGAGNDQIGVETRASQYFGDSGNDLFESIGFSNTFNGGSGSDTISYVPRSDETTSIGRTGVDVRLNEGKAFTGNATFETLISIENVRGSNNADTIVGNDVANLLEGFGGNDLIAGLGGNDILKGGAGNDELQGGAGNDRLHGGSGNDRLFGEDGNDKLFGDSGSDKLFGEAGNDTMEGGSGNDLLQGGSGTDVISGDDGNDDLKGDSGNDTLNGGAGNDKLNGGSGNDKLRGGEGKDTLTGGSGDDRFVFKSVAEISQTATSSKRDVITDFVRGSDKIDFSAIDANTKVSGNQAFTLRSGEQSGFTGAAGQLYWDKIGSGDTARTIISGDRDGDKIADFQLELIGHFNLTGSDFIL
ncbi:calcium-binding protein [Devosia sp. 2618]|uniref:calcium-binding protein n=1 Tax=Devosia sp. 2618 TaxID=3156454 RepID=UPI003393DEC2